LGLVLEHGVASHYTFARIFQLINLEDMENCFTSWVKSISMLSENEIVSFDRKTVRGSRHGLDKAIHLVNAWVNDNGLVLGQTKVDAKSNETTAIPVLLKKLDLKNCIITMDATGTQKCVLRLPKKGKQVTVQP